MTSETRIKSSTGYTSGEYKSSELPFVDSSGTTTAQAQSSSYDSGTTRQPGSVSRSSPSSKTAAIGVGHNSRISSVPYAIKYRKHHYFKPSLSVHPALTTEQ